MSRGTVLVVDDDAPMRRLLVIRLESAGFEVNAAASGSEALRMLTRQLADVIVSDLRMEDGDGLTLLSDIQSCHPGLPLVMVTAHGTIPDAVTATEGGAFAFLTKPVEPAALVEHVSRAISGSGRIDRASQRTPFATRNPAVQAIVAQAIRVARTKSSILICGPSGSGKEVLARTIHEHSGRTGEFVAVNCTAIPEALLESELFGHRKGAFTGASRDFAGLLSRACHGTVLLDEIGDMPATLQSKLLRVLQENVVRPVGGDRDQPIDVRILSATHRDLASEIAAGRFREDLYYRLNVIKLELPPLSSRPEDIPLLVAQQLNHLASQVEREPKRLSADGLELLTTASWPGNVRQLFNVVEHCVGLAAGRVISSELVRQALGDVAQSVLPLTQAREDFTRGYLNQVLELSKGNVSRAARIAKRNRTDFYKLLARHGVDAADFQPKQVSPNDDGASDTPR